MLVNRIYHDKDLHFAVKAVSEESMSQTFFEVWLIRRKLEGEEQEAGYNESAWTLDAYFWTI